MLAWLAAASAGGATVLIGDPGRSYLPRQTSSRWPRRGAGHPNLEDAEIKTSRVALPLAVKDVKAAARHWSGEASLSVTLLLSSLVFRFANRKIDLIFCC